MGDIIKLYNYRKPLIDMLLRDESPEKINNLKDLAHKYFAEGDIFLYEKIQKEYGRIFGSCFLTIEHGEILLIHKEIPYLIEKI